MSSRSVEAIATHPLLGSDFREATDRHTGTVVREGNAVQFLPSGVQSYAKRWELLDSARSSIDIVAFSMMRDETSARLRDLLREKARDGVKVRLILDDGVMLSTFAGGYLEAMVRAGAKGIRYHKVFRDVWPDWRKGHVLHQLARTAKVKVKRRFHEKYLVVDGTQAILGGINWGNKYAFGGQAPKAWRDTDVHLTGPVVGDIQRRFIHDFFFYSAMDAEPEARRQPGFDHAAHYHAALEAERAFIREHGEAYLPALADTGTERIRYVAHKPYDEQRLPLTEAVLLLLRNAQRYIYWGCHGVRPPRVIAETLGAAVERGVEVRLITNSEVSSRTLMFFGLLGWMYWESSNHFPWLLEHGIRIFEWQRPGAFHSKNLVIDDVVASVGSYNIARGSTLHHTESNAFVYGGGFPSQVRRQFEVDFADCRELARETVRKVSPRFDPFLRPLHERELLIDRSLLPPSVRADLDAGRYKTM
jgi:phosphatidylserine/phosphatidylglycerophosphate/cardiolipin synthase-like enzyme